jgi:hypothetical protein
LTAHGGRPRTAAGDIERRLAPAVPQSSVARPCRLRRTVSPRQRYHAAAHGKRRDETDARPSHDLDRSLYRRSATRCRRMFAVGGTPSESPGPQENAPDRLHRLAFWFFDQRQHNQYVETILRHFPTQKGPGPQQKWTVEPMLPQATGDIPTTLDIYSCNSTTYRAYNRACSSVAYGDSHPRRSASTRVAVA